MILWLWFLMTAISFVLGIVFALSDLWPASTICALVYSFSLLGMLCYGDRR